MNSHRPDDQAAFEEAALHAEAPEPAPTGDTPRLRVVDPP
jgi:hypothetical protein